MKGMHPNNKQPTLNICNIYNIIFILKTRLPL